MFSCTRLVHGTIFCSFYYFFFTISSLITKTSAGVQVQQYATSVFSLTFINGVFFVISRTEVLMPRRKTRRARRKSRWWRQLSYRLSHLLSVSVRLHWILMSSKNVRWLQVCCGDISFYLMIYSHPSTFAHNLYGTYNIYLIEICRLLLVIVEQRFSIFTIATQ